MAPVRRWSFFIAIAKEAWTGPYFKGLFAVWGAVGTFSTIKAELVRSGSPWAEKKLIDWIPSMSLTTLFIVLLVLVVGTGFEAAYRINARQSQELARLKNVAPKAYFKLFPREDTPEKQYLRLTPGDLERLFLGKTDAEIEELAKPFKGMWWAFGGTIAGLRRETHYVLDIRISKCAPGEPAVHVDFSHAYRQYAYQCYEGRDLNIEGKIHSLSATFVWVNDCTPITD